MKVFCLILIQVFFTRFRNCRIRPIRTPGLEESLTSTSTSTSTSASTSASSSTSTSTWERGTKKQKQDGTEKKKFRPRTISVLFLMGNGCSTVVEPKRRNPEVVGLNSVGCVTFLFISLLLSFMMLLGE